LQCAGRRSIQAGKDGLTRRGGGKRRRREGELAKFSSKLMEPMHWEESVSVGALSSAF